MRRPSDQTRHREESRGCKVQGGDGGEGGGGRWMRAPDTLPWSRHNSLFSLLTLQSFLSNKTQRLLPNSDDCTLSSTYHVPGGGALLTLPAPRVPVSAGAPL